MLVDGSPGTCIATTDRGLLYGDGLFETLLVEEGAPCLWTSHLDRLELGCKRLGMEAPARAIWAREARAAIDGAGSGVLKLILTRGGGGRGYNPASAGPPTRVVQWLARPEYAVEWTTDGVTARYCSARLGINPALAGIKHLNRLEQVLARAEWDDPEIAEGVMLDNDDRVVEGTMSNLFLVHAGTLVTPALDRCGIAGVMRRLVLDLARSLGIPAVIKDVTRQEVQSAEALFFTSSLCGIWPVRRLDAAQYDPGRIPAELRRGVLELGLRPRLPEAAGFGVD